MILFAGGDSRTNVAMEYLSSHGVACESYGLFDDRVPDCCDVNALILPYPCTRNGRLNAPTLKDPPSISELLTRLNLSKEVFTVGGMLPSGVFANCVDLADCEDLKLRNAVTTVEGVLALLVEQTDRSVFGMQCLVVGYGAIGKRLSAMLAALGAQVTVAARKALDRTAAALQGFAVQHTSALSPLGMDAVFNTVPVRLMEEEFFENCPRDVCIFELASAPGGFNPALAASFDLKTIACPGLPGKVAPITAGEDLGKTLLRLLEESFHGKGSASFLGT